MKSKTDLLTEDNDNFHDNTPITKSDLDGVVRLLQEQLSMKENVEEEKLVCAVRNDYRARRPYRINRQIKLTCYECVGEGHGMRECPSKHRAKQQTRCYNCGKLEEI